MKTLKEQLFEAVKSHDPKSWLLAVESGVSPFSETPNKSNSILLALNHSAPLSFIKLIFSTMFKEDMDCQKISSGKAFGGSLLNWLTLHSENDEIFSFLKESHPSLLNHLIEKEFKDNLTNPMKVVSRNIMVFDLGISNHYANMLKHSKSLLFTPESLSSWCSSSLLTRNFLEENKEEPLWTQISNHYHFIPLHQKLNLGDWKNKDGNTLLHILLEEDKDALSDSKKKILKFYARKNSSSLNIANTNGETPYYLFLKRVQKGDFSLSVFYEKDVVDKVLWKFEDSSVKSSLKLLEKLSVSSQYNEFDFQSSDKHLSITEILKVAHKECLMNSLKDTPNGSVFKGPRF